MTLRPVLLLLSLGWVVWMTTSAHWPIRYWSVGESVLGPPSHPDTPIHVFQNQPTMRLICVFACVAVIATIAATGGAAAHKRRESRSTNRT